jgi:hypothetical protein
MECRMTAATGRSRTGRVVGLAVLAVLVIGAVAAIAFAAAPVKGAKYSGHLKGQGSTTTVTFRVSASGKKVIGMRVKPYIPNRCGSGGPPPPQTSKPAKIKNGRFTATVKAQIPEGVWSATVTGKFLSGGKEQGVVKSSPRPGEPSKCGGNTPYTTSTK